LGRHPEAAEAFERVADLSADPGPFVEAATEWKAANEWGRALAILDRGIARLGRLVSLQEPALELEVRMNRVDAALKRLDQLIAATPRQEAWLVRRAEILADAHRTDDALTARDQATAAIAALPARLRHAPAARDLSRRLATLAVPAS
jgi:tetratricopeptide (TPR) repeat protein